MAKQHDKPFKLDAIQYYGDHKDLGVRGCAQNLGRCIKKSHQHSGKMTGAIYLEVSGKTEAAKKDGRRVSVPGMLKFLGVSRSGYHAWLHHVPSDTEKRCEAVKAKIQDIDFRVSGSFLQYQANSQPL